MKETIQEIVKKEISELGTVVISLNIMGWAITILMTLFFRG